MLCENLRLFSLCMYPGSFPNSSWLTIYIKILSMYGFWFKIRYESSIVIFLYDWKRTLPHVFLRLLQTSAVTVPLQSETVGLKENIDAPAGLKKKTLAIKKHWSSLSSYKTSVVCRLLFENTVVFPDLSLLFIHPIFFKCNDTSGSHRELIMKCRKVN